MSLAHPESVSADKVQRPSAPFWLIALSLVLFLASAIIVSELPQFGRVIFGAASGLAAASVVLMTAIGMESLRRRLLLRRAMRLVRRKSGRVLAFDARLQPVFDAPGAIDAANDTGPQFAFRDLFADPSQNLPGLVRRAKREKGFSDVLHRGHQRVSLQAWPAFGGTILCFDVLPADTAAPPSECTTIRVVIDASGQVLNPEELSLTPDIMAGLSAIAEGGTNLRIGDVVAGHAVQDIDATADRQILTLLALRSPANGPALMTGGLADTIEALPLPVMKVTPDGAITLANASARTLLGLDPANLPDLFEVVDGPGRAVSDWISDALAGHGLSRSEVVRAVRPGRDVFVQIAFARITDKGAPALLAVLTDATELKTLEAQFVQSQKMQAIGQLAGGVAHDFNNLLTAISGHADLMLLRHDEGDPDFSDLMQITQNANRAAALVGQLLAFSRKQTLLPELLDLRDTMADLAHLLNRLVGEKIHLDVQHATGLNHVRADKRQFEQVVMNLVVNARDAMPGGGVIAIKTQNVAFDVPVKRDRADVPAGDYVEITVQDDGIGIDPAKLPKIFEPFYTSKKVGEGTGLGLSTAYGIVKQTGGFIFAESDKGAGTCFTILLPAHKSEDVAIASPKPVQTTARIPATDCQGLVLLVEDEAPVRAFASRALRLRGHTVLEADSAEDALGILEDPDLDIDVFVTDVIMPGMDGPTWVRQALKVRPDTRVVFVSGYAEDGVSETQARVPNSVFLPKPFSLKDLTSTVQDQLISAQSDRPMVTAS